MGYAKLELQLTMILVLIKRVEVQTAHLPQDKPQTHCTVVTDAMDQDILEETLTHHLVWLRYNRFLKMLSILNLTANLHLGKLPTQCMEEMVVLLLLLRKDPFPTTL